MTKKKRKTRFVVEIDGKFRKILSISKRSDGGLLIATHLEKLYDASSAPLVVKENLITEYRHSVHLSDTSALNTVHGVLTRGDGSQLHKHMLTSAIRDVRFQPIYTRSLIHPSTLPELTLRAKEEVIQLPTYNPKLCTMHYALWFSSPEAWRGLEEVAVAACPGVWFRSRLFVVFMPFCYTRGPSPRFGRIIDGSTTSEENRSAEHIALGNRVGPAQGAPAHALVGYIIRDFNRIILDPPLGSGLQPDLGPLRMPQVPRFLDRPIL